MAPTIDFALYEQEFCDKDADGQVIKPHQYDGRNRKQLMEILVSHDAKYDSELHCENLIEQSHICHVILELWKLSQNNESGGLIEVTSAEEIDAIGDQANERLAKFTNIYYQKNHGGSGERTTLTSNQLGGNKRGRPSKVREDDLSAFIKMNHQESAMKAKQWKTWCEQHSIDNKTPLQFWVDYRIIEGKPSYNTVYKQIKITEQNRVTWTTIEAVKDGKDNYALCKKQYEKAEAKISSHLPNNTPNKMQKTAASSSPRDSDEEDFFAK